MMPSPGSVVVFVVTLVTTATAYRTYQTSIPNGRNVPNPCQPGTVWSGVGHQAPGGGGVRNPFGLAFAANNHNWTQVCPLDSDGDGRTNGEELGDANCTWTIGMMSPPTTYLSHPGICEPVSSKTCIQKNSWLTTCPTKYTCPAVNQPGVLSAALRLPPTPVPANGTTYVRYGVFLPNDTDYHMIANSPIINTSLVLRHMVLWGCSDGFTAYANYSTPQPSGIIPDPQCTTVITVWSVGLTGDCLENTFGVLIGTHGFKYALLELHWNNPTQSDSFVDSSGMNLYYTAQLRPNSGTVLITSQRNMTIPPHLDSYSVQGGCSSYCSSALPNAVNISSVFLHMNLLGRAGSVKLYRNGVLNSVIVDASYDYNYPISVTFDPPVEFRPRDAIVVNCTYQSTSQNSSVTWGETISNEMCIAFLSYYPVNPKFVMCAQWRTVDWCSNIAERCSTNRFTQLKHEVLSSCTPGNCSSPCKLLMQAIVDTGCTTDDYNAYHSTYGTPGTAGLTDLISRCGISTNPTLSTTSSRPNSAEGLSTKKSTIFNTAMSTMSIILLLAFTAGFM